MGRPNASHEPRVVSREKTVMAGLVLSLLASLIAGYFLGRAGALAALLFGALATAIQFVAGRLMADQKHMALPHFMKRWGAGMGLRLLGVGLVGVVIWLEPESLPALPAALAYVGVLIPLLFLEARRI